MWSVSRSRARLARAGREVVVEADDAIGTGVSSRNSEVIHAGIYHATGLAKTRLSVEGKVMLYRFCREYGVQHRRSGKLIVAADESEIAKLAALEVQAKANGVDDLLWLSGAEVRALEPALRANRALLSASTGIVDSHALMLALKGDAEAHGAMIALVTPVVSGRAHGDGVTIETGGAEPMRFTATLVVQSLAPSTACRLTRSRRCFSPRATTFRSPFARRFPGSSIRCRCHGASASILRWTSPGAVWTGRRMGGDDRLRRRPAARQILLCRDRTYWPDLPDGTLQPGYAGIRPKIARPGGSSTDFLIQTERDHGVRVLVNLFGIESPGLTSSLAIAEKIAKRL